MYIRVCRQSQINGSPREELAIGAKNIIARKSSVQKSVSDGQGAILAKLLILAILASDWLRGLNWLALIGLEDTTSEDVFNRA